jgi:hypothetical protein
LLLQWGKKQTKTEQCIVGAECKAELTKFKKTKREPAPEGGGWEYVTIRVKQKTKNPELCKI